MVRHGADLNSAWRRCSPSGSVEKEKQRRMGAVQQEIQAVVRGIQDIHAQDFAGEPDAGDQGLTGKLDMVYIAHEKRFVANLQIKAAGEMKRLAGLDRRWPGAGGAVDGGAGTEGDRKIAGEALGPVAGGAGTQGSGGNG